MALYINKKSNGRATIYAENDAVVMEGDIDEAHSDDFLVPFFAEVKEKMGNTLTIDISNLCFLNSNGIRALIGFIFTRKRDSQLTFLTDKDRGWQKISLNTIRLIDAENILIKTK
jgi:hypothetical protein